MKGIKKLLVGALALVSTVGGVAPTLGANAATREYSNVLTDLRACENFSIFDYPAAAEDKSLDLIQIGVSEANELFLYVYQPADFSEEITATTARMRMYTDIETAGESRDYNLKLLSTEGVFDKYLVQRCVVSLAEPLFVDITALHSINSEVVEENGEQVQVDTELAHEVGQVWKIIPQDETLIYQYEKTEVVEITDKLVSSVTYDDGFFPNWVFIGDGWGACISHFVAFKCYYDIEKLFEVDVAYKSQTVNTKWMHDGSVSVKYGVEKEEQTTLTETSTADNGYIFWGNYYEWERIQSVEEFLEEESDRLALNNQESRRLSDMQYVLRFTETRYTGALSEDIAALVEETKTNISNVSLMRMKFEVNGEVKNLGVVDNKTTAAERMRAGVDWWVWLAIAGAVLAVVVLCFFFAKPVFAVIKALFLVITFPVWGPIKGIIYLIEKARGER